MSPRRAFYILLMPSLRMINGRLGEPRVDDERWLWRQLSMVPATMPGAMLILARWRAIDRRSVTVA